MASRYRICNVLAILLGLLLVGAARPAVTDAADLILVDAGVAQVPIVLFENAPPMTRRAANDLASYIEKTSGGRPVVVDGTPDPLPERAIWVGYQPILKSLFPQVDFDFQKPEEILIAANANHLVIAGRDRWDPNHLVMEFRHFEYGNRDVTEGYQQEYGTVNAVYTFLQDHLGVRWFWPGEEAVRRQATIAFKPFEHRHAPRIRSRHRIISQYALFRSGGKPGTPGADWLRFQRMQLDSLDARVQGHGFGDWWERFHKSNPEYFALQPDGSRSGFPGGRRAKVCDSSPAVWEQWLADVDAILKENPTQQVFSAAANDSWASGHCICENCRAWDHPEGELRTFSWQGLSQAYVALSDRQVRLANELGRRLKARYPDKDYAVTILAYGHSRPVPRAAVPDDNVIIGSVASFLQRPGLVDVASPNKTTHREQFIGWGKVAPHIVWRPNVGNTAGWTQGGPISITELLEDFRLLAEVGAIGIVVDTNWTYWSTQGPLNYLFGQLSWDPTADGRAILDDFYQRGFGEAAGEIRGYFELAEQARQRVVESGEGRWTDALDAAFFEQADQLLTAAAAKVKGNKDLERRVSFVVAGREYFQLAAENTRLVNRLRETNGEDAEAMARAVANWKRIEAIDAKHPYALNAGHIRRNPEKSRNRAIHPEGYKPLPR